MKKFLKRNKKYLAFLYCYLVLLSVVGLSLTFSRYQTTDNGGDSAASAKYDIVIFSGESVDNQRRIDVPIYATSKITDTGSMFEGTYSIDPVTVLNNSDCDVSLTSVSFSVDPDQDYYSKVLYVPDGSTAPTVADIKTYLDVDDTATVADVNNAIADKNSSFDHQLKSGGSITMYVVSWVEHDNVYNDSNYNQTLAQIGVQPEHFVLHVQSEQVD